MNITIIVLVSISILLNVILFLFMIKVFTYMDSFESKLTLINKAIENESAFDSAERKRRLDFESKVADAFSTSSEHMCKMSQVLRILFDHDTEMNEHLSELDKHQIDIISRIEERFSQVYEEHRFCREQLEDIRKVLK